MKRWSLWTEGYIVTGQSSRAQYHGEFTAETLLDAVQAFKTTLTTSDAALIDLQRLTWWGCKFFDNETDARKSFG